MFHTTEWIETCLNSPLIPQRSAEWFQMRKTRITGSMCDTLIGSNPFQSWDQLVCEKAGMPVEFKGNAATQHGIDNEDKAIKLYEKETGRVVKELGLTQHQTIDILAHSPDGISLKPLESDARGGDSPILLEIKCPFRRQIKRGQVPKYYMGQLQLGIICLRPYNRALCSVHGRTVRFRHHSCRTRIKTCLRLTCQNSDNFGRKWSCGKKSAGRNTHITSGRVGKSFFQHYRDRSWHKVISISLPRIERLCK